MFKNPFSFNGRIQRPEYAITFVIYVICYILFRIVLKSEGNVKLLSLLIIPVIWFLWAQGAKRCHDLNKSGWWQIVPFYFIVLLSSKGEDEPNEYNVGYEPYYGAADYEKPYNADSLTNSHIEVPNADSSIQ